MASSTVVLLKRVKDSMEQLQNRLIVVLGMHRSGTSVITRGLQLMGVDLGDKLMPPFDGNNSKGFWEDLDINALNIDMLHALKSDWHFLTPIRSSDVEFLYNNGYLQRAVELLQEKTAGVQIFGFKDPRVAKLLPFWKQVFSHGHWQVSYILVLRHPLSVCQSLAKRDGLAFEKSYLLWLEHVLGSLTGTEGQQRLLVDYDRFMQTPELELTRMAQVLHLSVNQAELRKFRLEFLDPVLQHTIYQLQDLRADPKAPPLVQEVYSALLESATGNVDLENPKLQHKVAGWNREFSRMRPALALLDELNTTLGSITAERNALNAARSQLQREGAEIKQQLLAKEQTAQKLQAEILSIHQSRLWRWTKPLRRLVHLFKHSK